MQSCGVFSTAQEGLISAQAVEEVAIGDKGTVVRALDLEHLHLNQGHSYNGSDYQRFTQQTLVMKKTVLRYIGNRNLKSYLTPKECRVALGYPQSCLEECYGEASWEDIVGISNIKNYERSRGDRQGVDLSNIFICNSGLEVIFKAESEQFLDDEGESREPNEASLVDLKSKVQSVVAGKIIVGYNMGILLTSLQITHSRFIDIAHLYPEATPRRQSLHRIAKELLGVDCQQPVRNYRQRREGRRYRNRDDDSSDDDRRERGRRVNNIRGDEFILSSESANACLRIVEKHIEEGRGILCTLPARKLEPHNVEDMLMQAQIRREAVCGLFLRGSRAVDIHISNSQYTSDWDYVCILDTTAVINSVLVRLPQVDVLLFDRRSFQIYVNGGDLPMIELFFLPTHCIYVNQLPKPIVSIRNSKYSLVHHLLKADEKIAYYSSTFYTAFQPDRQYTQRPKTVQRRNRLKQHELLEMQGSRVASKDDPQYVKWKFIKIMHMQVRFVDLYLQIKQNGRITNPLAKTALWKQLEAICINQGHFKAYQVCKDELNRLLSRAFTLRELTHHYFLLYKTELNRQLSTKRQPRRHRRPGRSYRYYSRREQIDFRILSIYRRNTPVSSAYNEGQIYRINDVEDEVNQISQSHYRRDFSGFRRENRVILNTTALSNGVYKKSPFLRLFFDKNANKCLNDVEKQLDCAYLEPRQHYSIKYMQRQGQQPLEEELSSLTNYKTQDNANMQAEVVQEASACIMRAYLTKLQQTTTVYSLVCYMYKPFQQYGSIRTKKEVVPTFQGKEFDVFEKRDGALTALYFSGAGWVVGSKCTPDAREHIAPGKDVTVSDEFSRVFRQLGYRLPQERHRNKTFLFELLSTKITNTLPKSKDELILHGVRNMRTLQEQDPQAYAEQYGWQYAPFLVLNSKSLEEIASLAESRQNCEGFILRDTDYNRLIIRNPSVLKKKWQKQLDSIMQQPQQDLLIDSNRKTYFLYSRIVLKNRHQEYLQLFPEDQQVVECMLAYIQQVRSECMRLKEQIGRKSWEETEVDDLIVDKRIDILNFLHNFLTREEQLLFQCSPHTAVSFNNSFTYLLQYLHNHTPALS